MSATSSSNIGPRASLLPVTLQPLLRWRMEAFARDPRWMRHVPREYIEGVFGEVAERGPVPAAELSSPGLRPRDTWNGAPGKEVLGWLTAVGRLAVARRRDLQLLYDLPERVIPRGILETPTPTRDDARRELLMIAARVLGIGTAKDLADYFCIGLGIPGISERVAYPHALGVPSLLADLVREGRLITVSVEGWRHPAYMHPSAKAPDNIDARALLSPFDSMIWNRDRTARLFGFDYRTEIYVPAAKRRYGYYVLPFLLGDSLMARVDLKADRERGTLVVAGAFAEPGAGARYLARALGEELWRMATWPELEHIELSGRGDLAGALARVV